MSKIKLVALAASIALGALVWGVYNLETKHIQELTPQEYVAEQLRACAALESALRISLEEAETARSMEIITRMERKAHD